MYNPKTAPNITRAGQVRAFAHTFGEAAPTADSASGGFSRHIVLMILQEVPCLPVPRKSTGAGRLPLAGFV